MRVNRRQFLKASAGVGAYLALGKPLPVQAIIPACGSSSPEKDENPYLNGHRIIDAHAHPSQFYFGYPPPYRDESSTVEQLCEFGVEASVFAAAGDILARGKRMLNFDNDFEATDYQLSNIYTYLSDITIVDRAADIPGYTASGVKPGAIMAIEGGESLVGNPDNVNYFYQRHYVRTITLVHRTPNDHPQTLGDQMCDDEFHGGLSPLGRQVLERMMQLNMVVDVAHASSKTLLEVCQIAQSEGVPVIESHVSLLRDYYPIAGSAYTRLRPVQEMEAVASTGGVVCTWPLQCIESCAHERIDIDHWAEEILYLMSHLGSAHVGLGTDGGGGLPYLVDGYQNIKDLDGLANAMAARGLTYGEIHAYMGGNILRVLNQVLL